MKDKLKYIIAIVMACSIGVGFMPLVKIGGVNWSVMQALKLGIGKYGNSDMASQVIEILQEYMKTYIYLIFALLLILLVGGFFVVALTPFASYIIAIISSVAANVLVLGLCLTLKEKLKDVGTILDFFGIDNLFTIHYVTVMLWIVLHIVVIGLSIMGLVWLKDEVQVAMERQGAVDEAHSRKAKLELEETEMLSQLERIEQEKQTTAAPKPERFRGVIVEHSKTHKCKVHKLGEKEVYYLLWNNHLAAISETKEANAVAKVSYDMEQGEYAIEVLEQISIYLKSGQPLGKQRTYYLKRETELYVKDRNERFILA